MIFVTVGVSQPFDRLIKEVDRISKNIPDNMFAQIGRSYYEPGNIPYKRFLSQKEVDDYIEKSRIVITHGGFGSIFGVLSKGKPLISVPKVFELDKTDNDQTDLVRLLEFEGRLVGVYDIKMLEKAILEFNLAPKRFNYNTKISEDIDRQIREWF
ncbi:beta(1,3)galactosyltransferase EpsH [bacterium]|nr:beta(1,3)galactosyltransferase EpsH [bacterium]